MTHLSVRLVRVMLSKSLAAVSRYLPMVLRRPHPRDGRFLTLSKSLAAVSRYLVTFQ